jgi:Flp pilus assembly protein TadB
MLVPTGSKTGERAPVEQNAIIAWTMAALVVLVVGACTPVQALLGLLVGYTATHGGPVVQRWYEARRRI